MSLIKIVFAIAAFVLASFSVCAEEAKACPSRPQARKNVTASSAKPNVHEVTVFCGSATVTQYVGDPMVEKSATDGHSEPTSLEKLLEAIAKILSSIAWPIAAVFIAHYFKKELAILLARLKRLKAGAAEAEFADQLRETEEEVEIERTPDAQAVTPAAIEVPLPIQEEQSYLLGLRLKPQSNGSMKLKGSLGQRFDQSEGFYH
ncbi:hypothetical protein [Methylomonas sp. CM2]|uniref:hypothetical protein n=1 Tax=Methylomonas sp. CM2 TaxID=3417647 RepID=UPI003CE91132